MRHEINHVRAIVDRYVAMFSELKTVLKREMPEGGEMDEVFGY